MGDFPLELGQTVRSQDDRQGVIRYIGNASFAQGTWLGLELPDDKGKNDGSVNGERYFDCEPGHGIFVRPGSIVKVVEHPPVITNGKPIGKATTKTTPKSRPSSGPVGGTQNKRHSLIGQGLTPGSRLSLRSPIKSPTKQLLSSASSAASTPRTTTPTTTTARTSDSSAKSRLSTSSRPSMAPPKSNTTTSRTSRQSISGAANKTNGVLPASSMAPNLSVRVNPSARREINGTKRSRQPDTPASPTIDEEEQDDLEIRLSGDGDGINRKYNSTSDPESISPGATDLIVSEQPVSAIKTTQRSTAPGTFESRAAAQRETEQLRTKVRTLEKKRQADREKVNTVDGIRAEKDRFETIIQALQKKLQSSQQDIVELRAKCKDAEARASHFDRRDGEHESEIEMATLDKEMAEERVEVLRTELDALNMKHEELELETEILREENQELGSVMTPEEKASAGWLQMEREKERLKQALLLLRDMSHQTEAELRSQVKDLEQDLVEFDNISTKYQVADEKLSRSEATNKHLLEQLEATESNEDINLNLELEKDRYLEQIEEFKDQMQIMQDEAQVNDELERFHIQTQKELQEEIDMRQTLLNEREHTCSKQDKIIEDLEYMLSKFRDVVSGLQNDIDQLRTSRNISESEANELSNKSRAMMDLNMKLQNSASKTQVKTIDLELERMKAEESAQHLSIVQMFVSELSSQEKNPILSLMCFKRIKAKTTIICAVLRDRLKDQQSSVREETLASFEALQRLTWISAFCDRFVQFMSSCSVDEFSKYQNAMYELEPVERAMNTWIDIFRQDEIPTKQSAEDLSRMIAILTDLSEKLISPNLESKTNELVARSATIEGLLDIVSAEMSFFGTLVKSHVGDRAENESYLHFTSKIDHLVSKTRTMRFVASKVSKELLSRRSDSLGLTEPSWTVFTHVETSANELALLVRKLGEDIQLRFSAAEQDDFAPCSEILDLVTIAANQFFRQTLPTHANFDDGILALASIVQQLHSNIDEMHQTATDLAKTAEFERRPAPWIVRSRELRGRKIIPPDTEDQLRKLRNQVQDQVAALNGKDRQLEEHGIKIELLESRTKDSRQYTATVHRLEAELESLRRAKSKAESELESNKMVYASLVGQSQKEKAEIEVLKKAQLAGDQSPLLGVSATHDETAVLELEANVVFLEQEILGLQSAVRYLKTENHRLKVPSSLAGPHLSSCSWLEASDLSRSRPNEKLAYAAAESNDVLDRLLSVAASARPVALKQGERKGKTSWRAVKSTTKYQVLEQREELEKWSEWKDDLIKRVRVAHRIKTERKTPTRKPRQDLVPVGEVPQPGDDLGTPSSGNDGVTIVGSPP